MVARSHLDPPGAAKMEEPCGSVRHNRPAAIKGVTSAGSRQARRRKPLGVMMGCVLKLRPTLAVAAAENGRGTMRHLANFGDGLLGRIVLSG
jgi:hypothetical protein